MILYYSGNIDIYNRDNWAAIIGSRKANERELDAGYHLGQKFVRNNKVVVSGLAIGIDTKGHQGAVDTKGGQTLAIVNTPPQRPISPASNRDLAKQILTSGGIIYPYATDTDPKQRKNNKDPQYIRRLLERDILLAYLCPTVVVVKDSFEPIDGGTRIAVNYAYKLGKKVFRFDCNHKFHENPEVVPLNDNELNWNMELNFNDFPNIEFQYVP